MSAANNNNNNNNNNASNNNGDNNIENMFVSIMFSIQQLSSSVAQLNSNVTQMNEYLRQLTNGANHGSNLRTFTQSYIESKLLKRIIII
jgi:hypothetical protein